MATTSIEVDCRTCNGTGHRREKGEAWPGRPCPTCDTTGIEEVLGHEPPTAVDGTDVETSGAPSDFRGEQWLTLIPTDPEDERVWEWSLTAGRIVQTV